MSEVSFTGPWLAFADALGGPEKLAEYLGVSRMTLWRWANGRCAPVSMVRDKVNELARRRGLKEPFPKESRNGR